ncbi:MAG: GTP-binding protein, partial [Lysobacterales bacterium]
MTIWNRVRSALRNWRSREKTPPQAAIPERQLLDAHRNIRDLIEDTDIPSSVRAELRAEFEEVDAISEKLSKGEIHIAAFGRVGVGKSSLLNALLQRDAFATGPLHGKTRQAGHQPWETLKDSHVVLIDTPGIDELDGEERDRLAREVSRRADVTLMVCEADLTASEFRALEELRSGHRVVLLVLNKADRYTAEERDLLLTRLRGRCAGLLPPDQIVAAAADPRPEKLVSVDERGRETETLRPVKPDVEALKVRLWSLLEKEGRALVALNAAIFAGELDEKIATRIVQARKSAAERIIRKYCLGKGLLVALNPVPVTDLLAAAGSDIAMVIHLGEVYGFRLSKREASKLLLTISAQLLALMGAYWGMNLVSSALKTASVGLSTALTAAAQGALAWYATYLTGKMAQAWFS